MFKRRYLQDIVQPKSLHFARERIFKESRLTPQQYWGGMDWLASNYV